MQSSQEKKVVSEEAKEEAKQPEERQSNQVDFHKILNEMESRTTIMIRNIPNKFKQMTLLEMINQNHLGKYDYFYLPMDLKVSFVL